MIGTEILSEKNLDINDQTIVATASQITNSAITIVRISGLNSHVFVKKCLETKFINKEFAQSKLYHLNFLYPSNQKILDDPMIAFFYGKKSYTGQNSVEIFFHASSYVIQQVLQIFLGLGVRLAEAGEFTRRAYLNQKIDLVQAEGINKLISSHSQQEWLSARHLLSGNLQKDITLLRKNLISVMAFLEAQIDFPDEKDVSHLNMSHVQEKIDITLKQITKLIDTYESGKITSDGLRVALIGPPNAGKSTLMNSFLKKERAIVTDIPGTTRDYLEEKYLLAGRLISLIDTAGLRQTDDAVEKIGVKQTRELLAKANLILFLEPSDKKSNSEYNHELEKLVSSYSSKTIKLLSKCDLINKDQLTKTNYLPISCHSNVGIEDLKKKIIVKVDEHLSKFNDQTCITSVRQLALLEKSHESLSNFLHMSKEIIDEAILAFELKQAIDHLSKITGDIVNDDILNEIFSEFCIGK